MPTSLAPPSPVPLDPNRAMPAAPAPATTASSPNTPAASAPALRPSTPLWAVTAATPSTHGKPHLSPTEFHTRPARLPDAIHIFELVNSLSEDGTLLPRSYAELCENIRDFHIAETTSGDFLGCGALHLYGPHLAEIRSIVVKPETKGRGAGAALLRALLAEAEQQSCSCVCLFTRIPEFFDRFGFRTVDRTELPDKIYRDCQTCPRLYACDEVAMARGELPRISVLGPVRFPQPVLVKLQEGVIPHRR